MGRDIETKHTAYNLRFKEHEVFEDKLVVVDESDTPFIWLDKNTGKVSFGGKYFRMYKEQRLLEVLYEFVYAAADYMHGTDEEIDWMARVESLLKKFDELPEEIKIKQ
ncbi:hypothetical protein J14TS2_16280 [Bacillus sp. J14TS2]|uniref:hypothetical protein n=1 Tax=Bacillus sp. J14TS2 TaxID=2807188 RepID=UPI001B1017F6|nr:hypothetical protein [Bacillus sp. J14TS2]GIN71153.1 hypothetical protein J14TS2_16280 [Bacillus sp. J14TS2]